MDFIIKYKGCQGKLPLAATLQYSAPLQTKYNPGTDLYKKSVLDNRRKASILSPMEWYLWNNMLAHTTTGTKIDHGTHWYKARTSCTPNYYENCPHLMVFCLCFVFCFCCFIRYTSVVQKCPNWAVVPIEEYVTQSYKERLFWNNSLSMKIPYCKRIPIFKLQL